jgi:hypothetical protein
MALDADKYNRKVLTRVAVQMHIISAMSFTIALE